MTDIKEEEIEETCECGHEHHHHEHHHDCEHDHEHHHDHHHHDEDHECGCGHHHDEDLSKEASGSYKYKLKFEGLDCANCAAKIEDRLSKEKDIESVNVNFMNVTCSFNCDSSKYEEVKSTIIKIVNDMEPDVVVKEITNEKKDNHKYKYKLKFEGLDCANCAAKIEDRLSKEEKIKKVNVSFMNLSCSFDCESADYNEVKNTIIKIVKELEPEVEVKEFADDNDEEEDNDKFQIIKIVIAICLFVIGLFLPQGIIKMVVQIGAYIIAGYDVILRAIRNILKGQIFDENFLMALATIGALCLNDYSEAAAVMIFYQVGEAFQDRAVQNSRKSIAGLMNIRPDVAYVKKGNEFVEVDPEEVEVGDIIQIKPGEKVPLDGIVIKGSTSLDTSSLTGESVPKEVSENDQIISGCVNLSGLVEVKVTKEFGESTVSKILELVENTSERKAPAENFITKFAKVYTPIVVIGAVLLAVLLPVFTDVSLHDSLYRACTFLVISCPCALVISIPLSFFAGIGGLSKSGVLVKGANILEEMSSIKQVVFDKTGTLTTGKFAVTKIEGGNDVLKYAAYAEINSTHPIGKSIVEAYKDPIDKSLIKNITEKSGYGIIMKYENSMIYAGNKKMMDENNIEVPSVSEVGTIVYIAKDNKYLGYILVKDQIKDKAKEVISNLHNQGIEKCIMVTGDSKDVANDVANTIGLDDVKAQCLPQDKVDVIDGLLKQGKLVYVGDGINDAPVLNLASVGVAMGAMGSDAAIEAADIVIMDDDINKLATTIKKSKATKRIVNENIYGAIGVKVAVLIMGAFGLATMWPAIFADVGVAVLAILNAIRLLKK